MGVEREVMWVRASQESQGKRSCLCLLDWRLFLKIQPGGSRALPPAGLPRHLVQLLNGT